MCRVCRKCEWAPWADGDGGAWGQTGRKRAHRVGWVRITDCSYNCSWGCGMRDSGAQGRSVAAAWPGQARPQRMVALLEGWAAVGPAKGALMDGTPPQGNRHSAAPSLSSPRPCPPPPWLLDSHRLPSHRGDGSYTPSPNHVPRGPRPYSPHSPCLLDRRAAHATMSSLSKKGQHARGTELSCGWWRAMAVLPCAPQAALRSPEASVRAQRVATPSAPLFCFPSLPSPAPPSLPLALT